MSNESKAVFLSYASQDSDAAKRICDALRAAGVEVWFDQSELVGGDSWDQKIRGQIGSCALFVPVISAATQARREGYFRLEWKLAAQRTHMMSERTAFLLPVVIDDTRDTEADVPAEFRAVQWTRIPGGEAKPSFVERVRKLLSEEVGARAASPAQGQSMLHSPAGGPPALPGKSKRRWLALAMVGVAAAIALGFWALRPRVATALTAHNPEPQTQPILRSLGEGGNSKPPDLAPAKSTALDPHRIAVLPLDNFSPDASDEYLAGGMTEELTSSLSKISGLEVIARTSSERMKKSGKSLADIGTELRAGTLLEGSVRKAGVQLRISVQLIDVATQRHLWSQDYDTEFKDIFKMQTDVAQRVAEALKITLLAADKVSLQKKPTENSEAHRLYLLGHFHFVKFTAEDWSIANRYFTEAIQADPNYALAYCGMADNYGWQKGLMSGRAAWTREKELAEKALALDPALADAHASLGIALEGLYDWVGAERELKRALELNPNLALAHDQLGFILQCFGRIDEAIAKEKEALELDPASPMFHNGLAWWLYAGRRFDDAMAQTHKVLELDRDSPEAHELLGWLWIQKRQLPRALAEFTLVLDGTTYHEALVGHVHGLMGNRAAAEQVLRDFDDEKKQVGRYVSPGARMVVYLGLREKEKALDWLEKCYEDADPRCWFMKVDPSYDSLRGEPRFQAVLRKVGLEK